LNRLYVVDGTLRKGAVRIFDATNYSLIKNIDLPSFADWSVYDSATKYLYVNGNGLWALKTHSTLSIIDTTSGELVGRISVDDPVIVGLALDSANGKMYTAMRTKNSVAVIDLKARRVIGTWPFTPRSGSNPGYMALDAETHVLFENFANHRITSDPSPGKKYQRMLVFDTETGKELANIPINEHTDGLQYDPASKWLYVVAAVPPTVEVFQQIDRAHYKSLGEVPTEPGARTGILVPERHRFYVAVPSRTKHEAHILVYEVK
jgi:DNA-binding beta-propeller fold protein YncE